MYVCIPFVTCTSHILIILRSYCGRLCGSRLMKWIIHGPGCSSALCTPLPILALRIIINTAMNSTFKKDDSLLHFKDVPQVEGSPISLDSAFLPPDMTSRTQPLRPQTMAHQPLRFQNPRSQPVLLPKSGISKTIVPPVPSLEMT